MAKPTEISRLRSLVRRYRRLTDRMVDEAYNYTDGMDCPFCSGNDGYESANDRDDDTVKHARSCPTHQSEKLAAVRI